MTNEEAIRIAQGLITDFKCESETMIDFCNTIIKALRQEPCVVNIKDLSDDEIKKFEEVMKNATVQVIPKEPYGDCISRQAAIALAKDICVPTKDGTVYKHRCIDPDEIRELPPIQPEIKTDEDTISRPAVLDLTGKSDWFESSDDYNDFVCALCNLPPVTPKPKIGHWIDIMVGDMQAQACDQCKTFYPLAYTGGGHRFCPNCGARMEW